MFINTDRCPCPATLVRWQWDLIRKIKEPLSAPSAIQAEDAMDTSAPSSGPTVDSFYGDSGVRIVQEHLKGETFNGQELHNAAEPSSPNSISSDADKETYFYSLESEHASAVPQDHDDNYEEVYHSDDGCDSQMELPRDVFKRPDIVSCDAVVTGANRPEDSSSTSPEETLTTAHSPSADTTFGWEDIHIVQNHELLSSCWAASPACQSELARRNSPTEREQSNSDSEPLDLTLTTLKRPDLNAHLSEMSTSEGLTGNSDEPDDHLLGPAIGSTPFETDDAELEGKQLGREGPHSSNADNEGASQLLRRSFRRPELGEASAAAANIFEVTHVAATTEGVCKALDLTNPSVLFQEEGGRLDSTVADETMMEEPKKVLNEGLDENIEMMLITQYTEEPEAAPFSPIEILDPRASNPYAMNEEPSFDKSSTIRSLLKESYRPRDKVFLVLPDSEQAETADEGALTTTAEKPVDNMITIQLHDDAGDEGTTGSKITDGTKRQARRSICSWKHMESFCLLLAMIMLAVSSFLVRMYYARRRQ